MDGDICDVGIGRRVDGNDGVMSNFKKLLNDELQSQNLSCEKLGEMSGITGRAINYYAKGQRIPSIDVAHKVLRALGKQMVLGLKE